MPTIPPALRVKLDGGVTNLCRCWLLTRNDGSVLGFTDHDADLVIDGVICRADTGLSSSEATARLGLAVDGAEILGALSADSLSEDDLAAGRYDAAAIEVWLVDWSEPGLKVLLARGTLGEVRREGAAFAAEWRSLADRLNQETGRLYAAACAADLGDARCKVDLGAAGLNGAGSITAVDGSGLIQVSGLDAFAPGWFTGGKLTFTAGGNAGLAVEVKNHAVEDGGVGLALWQVMPQPLAAGDAFTVTAGCDKRFATCRDRFANAVNYRGFPHIPGNDFVISYPMAGEPGHDGAALGEQT